MYMSSTSEYLFDCPFSLTWVKDRIKTWAIRICNYFGSFKRLKLYVFLHKSWIQASSHRMEVTLVYYGFVRSHLLTCLQFTVFFIVTRSQQPHRHLCLLSWPMKLPIYPLTLHPGKGLIAVTNQYSRPVASNSSLYLPSQLVAHWNFCS